MDVVQNISLARERSRAEVYFICGGAKLWIPSPADMQAVGFDASRVQVVSDGALSGYVSKPFAAPSAVKASAVYFDCGADYDALDGKHYRNCRGSFAIVRKDVIVAGWLKEYPFVNQAPHGVEDIHYNLTLDADYITRVYGPGGLSTALASARLPGNSGDAATSSIRFDDVSEAGTSRGVTYNSFIVPGNNYDLHGELNAWHVNTTGGLFTSHWEGRGSPPPGWLRQQFGNDEAWFPFDVFNPDGTQVLREGDYVLVRGTLWQDHGHTGNPLWERAFPGYGGWMEMHPIDWIVPLTPPPTAWRKTIFRVALCTDQTQDAPAEVVPDFPASTETRRRTVLGFTELIDGRFTDMSTVTAHQVTRLSDRLQLQLGVHAVGSRLGRFKAAYIVAWRETDQTDVVWVDDSLPAGAVAGGDEAWAWVTAEPLPFSGARAHRSDLAGGVHQHFFSGATQQLAVLTNDVLFAEVFLDSTSLPNEVMLQWNDGSWEHRAYWGANTIGWGVDGTTSRRYMGALPPAGGWIRLEVPARLVGLEGRSVNGMAFTLAGGRAAWDYAGKAATPPNVRAWLEPRLARYGRPAQYIVRAVDRFSGSPVAGSVSITNPGAPAMLFATNTSFTFTFRQRRIRGPHGDVDFVGPDVLVTVPGVPEIPIDLEGTEVPPRPGAVSIAQFVPTVMRTGQQYAVSVAMRNTGETTWTSAGANAYRLGSQNPQDNTLWGLGRVGLPMVEVPPGAAAVFTFQVTAPATAGRFNFQWRMLQEMVTWFGEATPNAVVDVRGPEMATAIQPAVRLNVSQQYVVSASDADTGAHLSGTVHVKNPGVPAQAFALDAPFTFRFRVQRVGSQREVESPDAWVSVPGYADTEVDLRV